MGGALIRKSLKGVKRLTLTANPGYPLKIDFISGASLRMVKVVAAIIPPQNRVRLTKSGNARDFWFVFKGIGEGS